MATKRAVVVAIAPDTSGAAHAIGVARTVAIIETANIASDANHEISLVWRTTH